MKKALLYKILLSVILCLVFAINVNASRIDRINGLVGSIAVKAPVKVTTTANITLSGAQTIAGVALTADATPRQRVLVNNQTNDIENGIYDVNSGAWTRSPDFDGARDAVDGTQVLVNEGVTPFPKSYYLSATNPVVIGTDSLTFVASTETTLFSEPDYTEADQGVTGGGNTIKAAVDAIGAEQGTIYLKHNSGSATTTYTLTTSETIPSNVTIEREPGAIIDGAGTLTFTDGVNFVSGLTKAFGSSLTIVGLDIVNALWWGLPGDGVIQYAIDSGAIEVIIKNTGVVYLADDLTIPSTLKILRGVGFPVLTPSVDTHVVIEDGGSDLLITGINFTGNAGGSETTANQLIQITSFDYLRIKDNIFTDGWHRATYLINCDNFELTGNDYVNCSNGPYFTGCDGGLIESNLINGSQQADSVFKIGIALQTIDATYGQNRNIEVLDNTIKNLWNAQAILGHGGFNITVNSNNSEKCAQGINFNRQTSGDNVINLVMNSNNLVGVATTGDHDGAGNAAVLTDSTQFYVTNEFVGYKIYNHTDGSSSTVTANTATTITGVLSGGTDDDWDANDVYAMVPDYVLAADVGITVSSTGEKSGEITLGGNNAKGFNHSLQNVNLGAISIIGSDGVNITGGNLADCYGNGVVFSGANSSRAMVQGINIHNISGSTDNGGVKVDTPTIVTGLFKDNWITNCDKAYRFETAALPDLVVESLTETDNTNTSTGLVSTLFNGARTATAADATPSVSRMTKYLILTNSGATNVTDLDDGEVGQAVTIRDTNSVTTLKDASTGGSFQLFGGADFVFSANDSITVTYNGSVWLEDGRSVN